MFESGFLVVDWNHFSGPRNDGYIQLRVRTTTKPLKSHSFGPSLGWWGVWVLRSTILTAKVGTCDERKSSPATICWQSKALQSKFPRFSKATMHTYIPTLEPLFEGDCSAIEKLLKPGSENGHHHRGRLRVGMT